MIIRNRRLTRTGARAAALAVILAAVASLAFAAAAAVPAQGEPDFTSSPIYTWLQEHKTAAYWAAPLLMIVVAILPIPAEIPAAMNGMLFGAGLGIIMTWGGAMIGAMISYELARCFGRQLSWRFVKPEVIEKLDGLKDTEAAVLLMLRFTPVVAFTVVNWASGLLQVRRSTFAWTTAVGILPGAIAFTASGSAISLMYRRYPGTVTAVVAVLCGALLFRVWWKQRAVPIP
jgi:uncharacterized membrane protein YdjX (TVP38/TMEM64 family)